MKLQSLLILSIISISLSLKGGREEMSLAYEITKGLGLTFPAILEYKASGNFQSRFREIYYMNTNPKVLESNIVSPECSQFRWKTVNFKRMYRRDKRYFNKDDPRMIELQRKYDEMEREEKAICEKDEILMSEFEKCLVAYKEYHASGNTDKQAQNNVNEKCFYFFRATIIAYDEVTNDTISPEFLENPVVLDEMKGEIIDGYTLGKVIGETIHAFER